MKFRITNWVLIVAVFILGSGIYWSCAYPTITWWESSEYSAAASCLGITGAPGSIIMTFLGWTLSGLSTHPSRLFNLLAGGIASMTVVFTFVAFRKIVGLVTQNKQVHLSVKEFLFLFIVSGIILNSSTLFEYAIQFTPYVLTPLFTLFILLAVLNWWEDADGTDQWKKLFGVTLLIGIDFSVHRTNAVLVPGIILLMLIRNYKVFLQYKSYLAALSGILSGWSLQLLYVPMSLNDPPLNMGETNTLAAWWDFISLKQYGGNFLTDILQRKAPFWDYQIPYYLKGFARNFFHADHPAYLLGMIPALLGLIGIGYMFRFNRKFATASVVFFLITILTSIIYFNLPENYFRTIYRHYLPTFILFAVYIFFGLWSVILIINRLKPKMKNIMLLCLFILLAMTAVTQYLTNIKTHNGSGRTFTADHALNVLHSVDMNAIIFNVADNHYFPEMYLQIGEKVRCDILHCNLSLLNLEWYRSQLLRHDPDFPFMGEEVNDTTFVFPDWQKKQLTVPLPADIRREYSAMSDTFRISLPALRENNMNLAQDVVLFNIIRYNLWRRPLYFIKQYMDPAISNWLKPYLSDEGLVYRLIPDSALRMNIAAIEKNLENFRFSGYNNEKIIIDEVSAAMAKQYYIMFLQVIDAAIAVGDHKKAAGWYRRMVNELPPDRINPGEEIQREILRLEATL